MEKGKSKSKKKRLDPWEEYKVVHTYNTETDLTLKDILTSKEFVDYMYRMMIKYTDPE